MEKDDYPGEITVESSELYKLSREFWPSEAALNLLDLI